MAHKNPELFLMAWPLHLTKRPDFGVQIYSRTLLTELEETATPLQQEVAAKIAGIEDVEDVEILLHYCNVLTTSRVPNDRLEQVAQQTGGFLLQLVPGTDEVSVSFSPIRL